MHDWTDLQAAVGREVAGHRLGEVLSRHALRSLRLSDRCDGRFHLLELDDALRDELLAGVDAPRGTIPVLASGVLDERWGYLITAETRGPTLDDLLEQGPVEPGQALELLRSLARGWATLHARGLLLLDVRPADVIVEGWDEQGVLLPPHPALVGRPIGRQVGGYCAPEVAWDDPDVRADLFNLGVLGYELVTGATPHNPDAPPGERTLLPIVLPDDVPPTLARVIRTLLENEASDRYPSMEHVLDALGPGGTAQETTYGHFTPAIPDRRVSRPMHLVPPEDLPPVDPASFQDEEGEDSIFSFLLLLVLVWVIGAGLSVGLLLWW